MTLTNILILNILLDAALLSGLAYAMSRATRLTPHRPGVSGNAWRLRRPLRHGAHAHTHPHAEFVPPRLHPATD